MHFKELSNYANGKIKYYIYAGISEDIENLSKGIGIVEEKDIRELLEWYKTNVMISYNDLKEKFNSIK